MEKMHDSDPGYDLVESIYDALDRDDPDLALRLARGALDESVEADPVIHFLAGVALLELDDPEQAAATLSRAVELDPDDAEFRANLAFALYRSCAFSEAVEEARRALEADSGLPDTHFVLALLLERSGDAAADSHFKRAAELDDERFPLPSRLGEAEFEAIVLRARDRLPEKFARHLDSVAVSVEPLPDDAILNEEEPPLDPELFGLFVGVPLTGRSVFSPGGDLPPRILLFKRNLERCFTDRDELEREIAVTLYHELGHYLGMNEEELVAIDLD
jgi:predicted Zn-dependent protease with MMP-like domain